MDAVAVAAGAVSEAGDVESLHRAPAAGELEPVSADDVRAVKLDQDDSVIALGQRVG